MSITLYKDLRFLKKLNIYKSFGSRFLPSLLDGLACLLSTPCLILTKKPIYFQNSLTIDTGLSDFHIMTLTVMKVFYSKPNIITYLKYGHFSNETFMSDIKNSASWMTSENNSIEFNRSKTALEEGCSHKKVVR